MDANDIVVDFENPTRGFAVYIFFQVDKVGVGIGAVEAASIVDQDHAIFDCGEKDFQFLHDWSFQ